MQFSNPHKHLIKPGSVLLFRRYPFEDGGYPSDKIMIVLHCNNANDLVTTFTFTTSNINSKKIPLVYQIHEFCSCELCIPINIDFFFFKKGVVVGDNGFSFKSDCIVMFQGNIRERNMSFFEGYSLGSSNDTMQYLTSLNKAVMISLLNCILKSNHISPSQESCLIDSLQQFN